LMKSNKINTLAILLALSFSVSAQAPRLVDQTEQNLRKHIEYLASDKLEGRRTGERGATYAAGYISNLFANYKLRPGFREPNGKRSYLQPFPFVAGVAPGAGNVLNLKTADPTKDNGIDAGLAWSPLAYSPDADIPVSQVVFAGYGISSPDLKYDDYAGLDVRNKVVLIFDGNPDEGNPHSGFVRFNRHVKASIAKEKGARAILIIATDPDFKNDPLSRMSYDQTYGTFALPAAGVDRLTGVSLLGLGSLDELSAFEKQVASRPAGTNIVIKNPVNATAQLKISMLKKQTEGYNVIGILEGTDPILKSEAIVIGAHYDHLGHGGEGSLAVNSNEIHHGADDNASGTSAVLELGRLFSAEKKNKRTIIFIAFSGEEEGLLGSDYYVNHPSWPLEKTAAMINLDMVGRLNKSRLNIGGVGTASEWRPLVERANPKVQLVATTSTFGTSVSTSSASAPKPLFDLQLSEDGFGPSDHSSFYSKKIPVLFFFTGTHEDYHKPSDTYEKINFSGLVKILYLVRDLASYLVDAPIRPTYTVAKSTGMSGRSGFNVSLGTIPNYADSNDGLLLDGVRENSPAAKAGVMAGDKVVKLAGKDVRNVMDYTYILGELKAGEEYEMVVQRGGERLTLKIVPAPAARR
ncbi:MAG TPA: M28 family peptidase, partial [Pyrinomonadaceae bacterium]|nr:M28 family peptidase [Pyrinomonadaceae bacterium]